MFKRSGALLSICLFAAMVCGCVQKQQYVYTKLDGTVVTDQVKFHDDKTFCLAEMDRADVAGTVVPDRNVFIEANNKAERAGKLDRIMEACMLQRGYRLKPVTIQAATQ
jgi:hypothetical protein